MKFKQLSNIESFFLVFSAMALLRGLETSLGFSERHVTMETLKNYYNSVQHFNFSTVRTVISILIQDVEEENYQSQFS